MRFLSLIFFLLMYYQTFAYRYKFKHVIIRKNSVLKPIFTTANFRTVQVTRKGPGAGFGFTLSGSSPVFIKTVDRGMLQLSTYLAIFLVVMFSGVIHCISLKDSIHECKGVIVSCSSGRLSCL